MSLTSVDLPEPDTPVTATNSPSGNADVDVLQVVLVGAVDGELAALGARAAYGGDRDLAPAGEVLARSSSRRARAAPAPSPEWTTWPPCSPAPGPMSTTQSATRMVSSSCSTTIRVLPRSLEPDQGLDQPVVVALVEPDRRLVEDVEDADQAGADLGREPDPLRLAAGQRPGRPVEGEVVEADVEQEVEPLVDLLEDPLADLLLARGQVEAAQEVGGLVDRQRADVGDVALRPRSPRPRPA